MQTQHIAIRETQKKSWNTFAPGWKKWDDFTMHFLQTQGDQIIDALDLQVDDNVLDIASGTGEPGLSIASIAHKGFVTAVNLSEGMLQIASEKAEAKGVDNFYTLAADASELPFKDHSFDAISCRLGFMFFPDMQLAAKEMVRVLKPGGKLATTVWNGPTNNLWITALVGTIKKYADFPAPLAGAPGMFRCAQPGFITSLFEEVGLPGGMETTIDGEMHCRSIDEYGSFMNDVVPPVVAVFSDLEEKTIEKIKREVYQLLTDKLPGDEKNISFGARLFTAVKPI